MSSGVRDTARNGRLYLIGFMGAGKTTVGKSLATKLRRDFVDVDSLIVEKTGMRIADIFSSHGEPYFRNVESTVLAEIAKLPRVVVATGGGVVLSVANRQLMHVSGITIYLEWPDDILLRRISGDPLRPLAASSPCESETSLGRRLQERLPLYEQAAVRIRCRAAHSPDQIVSLIIKQLDLEK